MADGAETGEARGDEAFAVLAVSLIVAVGGSVIVTFSQGTSEGDSFDRIEPENLLATKGSPPPAIDPSRYRRWTLDAAGDRAVTITMDFVIRR